MLLIDVDLRNGNYTAERKRAVYREMLDRLRALPGVRSASASDPSPLCGCWVDNDLVIEGYTANATVHPIQVSDRYFETLGIAIVAGRDFNNRDTPTSPHVAIINQTTAKKYFGAANPLGKRYRTRRGDKLSDPVEIVGIVKDSKSSSLRDEIFPTIYVALSQDREPYPQTGLELRAAAGPPTALIAAVKSTIAAIDRNVSLEFTTMSTKIDKSLARERLLATLSGFFGALALLLATIGLYGVTSYNVARRRNEIGIRMALGAGQSCVLRMVLNELALLIGIGLVVGLGVALATTRFVASFLYGLQPNDPLTLLLAASVLGGVGALAGYLPARRASRLDPMTALREE